MQRTCRRKIEKTTCKRRCCRGQRVSWRPQGRRSHEGWAPGRAAPSLGQGLVGRQPSLSSFLAASCEGWGGPFPILVAVAGGPVSPPGKNPVSIPALRLGSLPSPLTTGEDKIPSYLHFLPHRSLPSEPLEPHSLFFPCLFSPPHQFGILQAPTLTLHPRWLSRSPRLAYSKRHHNIGFY